MTLVTAVIRAEIDRCSRPPRCSTPASIGGARFGFQARQTADDHPAAIDLYDSVGLQPGEVAGDELAHGAALRCQFLVTHGQNDFDPFLRRPPFFLCETEQEGGEPLTDSGE